MILNGINECEAVALSQIRHARSSNGYRHMAKTIASGVGLTNAWLAEQGLLSMKTLWAQLAPLR
jgi:RNA-directed DNA polymerase